MKRILWYFSLLLAVLLPALSQALTAQQVYHQVKDSIFTLYSFDFHDKRVKARGSAVAIGKTILVTSCHVALSGDYLVVKLQGEQKPRTPSLFYKNEKKDICLLEVPGANFVPVKLRPSAQAQIGEEVYAIGNPRGTEKSLSKGVISNKHKVQGGTWLQTDAALYFGSSGGGLFDAEGRLIGITAKMGGNFGFAIPTEWVLEAMPSDHSREIAAHPSFESEKMMIQAEAIKKLFYIGSYGKDNIKLYRNFRQCFLIIPGTDTNGNQVSIIFWNPKFTQMLVIFPSITQVEEGVSLLSEFLAKTEKEFSERLNYKSESTLYMAGQDYPLYASKTERERYPFLITTLSESPRAVFLTSNSFQIVFKDKEPRIGYATVLYHLKGIAEALSSYSANCQ